jgi:hypothetical protein
MTFTVAANSLPTTRIAVVHLFVFGGKSYALANVNQAGVGVTPAQECNFAVYPESAATPATGQQVAAQVSASQSTCTWTAQPSDTWIQVTSSPTGQGSGSLSYIVAPNPTTSPRSSSIVVNDAVQQVQQDAGSTNACSVSLGATSASATAAGGNATVPITANDSSCPWNVSADVPWITFPSGASGSGSQTLTYAVAANTTQSTRTGNILLGSSKLTVTQPGAAPVVCTAILSPTSASVPAGGGTGSFTVTIPASCSWTATPDSSWITVTSGGSGTGNGTISYQVQPNSGANAQVGHIAVADKQFAITEAGGSSPATLTASPNPITACNANGLGLTVLTWNVPGVAMTSIAATSPSSSAITTGGATGSFTTGYWVSDGMTFFLSDGSGNVLAQVTVNLNCGPLGTVPSGELTEQNASSWQFQALAGGAPSDVGSYDETNSFQVGTASVGFGTNNGDTIMATYPNPASQPVLWDLSGFTKLNLWLSTDTGPAGFPSGSPSIQLSSANGQLTIAPAAAVLNNALHEWLDSTVPLVTSDNNWTVTQTSNFDITHVTSIQLTFKASSPGMGILMDGLQFMP